MTAAERQEILDRLKAFANQESRAEHLADQGSLDRAADIMKLYKDKSWVKEVDPPKTRRNRGRPVDPESFSRFSSKYLTQKTGLKGAHAYRLRDAHELRTNYFSQGEIKPTGERELRPLKWMSKNGYGDRIPEVWKIACKLAGNQAPDSPTVRRALAQWKHNNLPKAERKTAERGAEAQIKKWVQDAKRFMQENTELFLDALEEVEDTAERTFTTGKAAA